MKAKMLEIPFSKRKQEAQELVQEVQRVQVLSKEMLEEKPNWIKRRGFNKHTHPLSFFISFIPSYLYTRTMLTWYYL